MQVNLNLAGPRELRVTMATSNHINAGIPQVPRLPQVLSTSSTQSTSSTEYLKYPEYLKYLEHHMTSGLPKVPLQVR